MKCDKLKAEPMIINDDYTALYYPKDSVDAAIAELKAENENIKDALGGTTIAYKQVCDEYEQCNKELRATKRALWLARAESAKNAKYRFHRLAQKEVLDPQPHGWRCYINGEVYPTGIMSRRIEPHYWCDIWEEVERKCRAKAEEYK